MHINKIIAGIELVLFFGNFHLKKYDSKSNTFELKSVFKILVRFHLMHLFLYQLRRIWLHGTKPIKKKLKMETQWQFRRCIVRLSSWRCRWTSECWNPADGLYPITHIHKDSWQLLKQVSLGCIIFLCRLISFILCCMCTAECCFIFSSIPHHIYFPDFLAIDETRFLLAWVWGYSLVLVMDYFSIAWALK